ncbi:MAG TPA: hypothetical protein VK669_12950 [Candidatus Limnocylindrales bacterium]|nr:hypothetical protein [Candidatus Limnocylindrales bacterium]
MSVSVNGVMEGAHHIPARSGAFTFAHVPVPNDGWNAVEVDVTTWHGLWPTTTSVTYGVVNKPLIYTKPATSGVLFDAKALAGTSDANVFGQAAPRQAIVIYDSLEPPAHGKPPPDARAVGRVRADGDGSFEQTVALPTGTHHMWAATLGCASETCSAQSPDAVVIDHSAPPPAAFTTERSIGLNFGYQRLGVVVDAAVPITDPVVADLERGVKGDTILSALYGDLDVNERPIRFLFGDVVPSFTVRNDRVDIHLATEEAVPPPTLPAFTGRVVITNAPIAGQRLHWNTDVLTVHQGPYQLTAPLPAQDRTERDGAVTWDQPFASDGGRIAMTLSFAPWSGLSAARSALSLSTFSLFPDAIARFAEFAGGLIFAIPMLAYAVLAPARAPLRLAARFGTAVCVSPQVFFALASSQPDVADMLGVGTADAAFITPIFLIAVCAVFASLTHRLPSKWWAVVVHESMLGIMLASALFELVAGVAYFVDNEFPAAQNGNFWYFVFITAAIGVVVVLALYRCGFYTDEDGRISWPRVALTAVIALAQALPLTFTQYVEWGGLRTVAETILENPRGFAAVVYDYLRQAAILSNFAFGLALVWTAFARKANGLSKINLLRVILCCYAVPATTTFVLVPVSFILAWLSFPFILNAKAPAEKRRTEVRKNRAELVNRLLYGRTVDELVTEVQDLEDQHMLGKVENSEFEQRSVKLRAALDDRINTLRDVFGVAPKSSPREAANVGLWVGVAFVLAHLLLFLSTATAGLRVAHTAFPLLVVSAYVATGFAQFVGPAFVFGACYEEIRGRSGLQKGLAIAAWVILCSLPSWWLRLPGLTSVAAIALETALFYTVLGITFDVAIVREGIGVHFRLRDLPRLSGLPALSWAGSIILASLGVALSGAMTGQFQNVVTSTITSVYRQAVGP